ncbi:hypothetical protein KAR91_04950 [Candidatus Pacearchaeota archaeon]|nr:hypothetical protein [Candidatus Pacearchaeota archaeon]
MDGRIIAIIAAALTALISALVWYLKYQTKHQAEKENGYDKERIKRQDKIDNDQKEDRDYYRGIVKDELKKNIELNVKGITLQKEIIKDFMIHNGHIINFQKKAVESLNLICDSMKVALSKPINGIIDRRKLNKKVKSDRRKQC